MSCNWQEHLRLRRLVVDTPVCLGTLRFDYRSMQWHHDTKGKGKDFRLLTDVATDGQCTHFVRGSHMDKYDRKDNGRRSQAQVDQMMTDEGKSIARAAGEAGTVWILIQTVCIVEIATCLPRAMCWSTTILPGDISLTYVLIFSRTSII